MTFLPSYYDALVALSIIVAGVAAYAAHRAFTRGASDGETASAQWPRPFPKLCGPPLAVVMSNTPTSALRNQSIGDALTGLYTVVSPHYDS